MRTGASASVVLLQFDRGGRVIEMSGRATSPKRERGKTGRILLALPLALRAGRIAVGHGTMHLSPIFRREVIVSARAVLVLCALCVPLTVAAYPSQPPSSEEIAAAIRQLG